MSAAHTKLEFHAVRDGSTDSLAILILNRPSHANSFSAQMMEEITFHLETVGRREDCRCLLITGAGKHVSGGADLSWMQASAKLSYNENIKDAARLTSMFESVYHLQMPTVAAIRGAVYGGALGLIACCDFAVAHDQARFCLSEAKLGLLPAVIMPYLARKMRLGQLRRHSLTGRIFSALEAQQFGL
ncbi:MAG: enoyl-CoA hydratase-related protein, partial [Proteobacteria bacterium]|nr:enoyl-CoA hydratase-related protein [Pseudomonadota bacterium]